MRLTVIGMIVLLCPILGWAQGPEWEKSSEAYQGAMKAYLEGDFDQAILLDTQAIQADAKNQKASDLLAVLVKEKEQNRKSEIWIGSQKPAPAVPAVTAPAPIPAAQPAPLKVRHVSIGTASAAMEARVETIMLLMGRNSSDQYRELTASQVDTIKRVDDGLNRLGWFRGFQWLTLIITLAALGMAHRARVEIKRLRMFLEGNHRIGEERGNVIPLDGTFH